MYGVSLDGQSYVTLGLLCDLQQTDKEMGCVAHIGEMGCVWLTKERWDV
jgi:hypothetical protein